MRDARHPGPGPELECGPHSQVLQIEDYSHSNSIFNILYFCIDMERNISIYLCKDVGRAVDLLFH